MKNMKLNLAKTLLLALTLAVMTFGMMPVAIAAPGDITIECDGSDNLCASVDTGDIIIDVYFGKATRIIIEL